MLNSAFGLFKMNGEPICIDREENFILGLSQTNWAKKSFSLPNNYQNAQLMTDAASERFILYHGDVQGGKPDSKLRSQVVPGVFKAQLDIFKFNQSGGVDKLFDRQCTLDSKELFGEIQRSDKEQPVEPGWRQQYGPPLITPESGWLGAGVFVEDAIYIPYTVECSAIYGSKHSVGSVGPSQTGLLYATGDQSKWTKMPLLDAHTFGSWAVATPDNIYCFANRIQGPQKLWGLWCSTISRTTSAQPVNELIAPTYCHQTYGICSVATSDETVHLVWLDGRHQRRHDPRSIVTGGQAWEANFEIYYRRRKDSESEWNKEMLLSKGIDYVFGPQMAVEGNNIVVVWSGYQGDKGKTGSDYHPSDIYFRKSADGGETWTLTSRVTTNSQAGLVSGRPQVALHNGIIHLFYIRGKVTERRAGVGKKPWAIIHQQRAF